MFTRRRFIGNSVLAIAGATTVRGQGSPGAAEVQVEQGVLRGQVAAGVMVFRGVPFAQPPVGDLRFRAPLPPQSWTDVREAGQFAPASLQPNEPGLAQSEDCLYLNVWAPQKGGPFPVLVWIHGGGFTGGSSFTRIFDGTEFARAGIVVVTVAYRLGALGFMDVSPMLGEQYAGSENNALRDLIAGLQWVAKNIHAFGGEAGRVTLGGESAGAKLTDTLMGVPAAAGLFHQMISESGGAERMWPAGRAGEIGAQYGKLWTARTKSPVSALLTAPGRQIVEQQTEFIRQSPVHFPFRVGVREPLVPVAPLTTIRGGSTRHKRLLLGSNRDESAFFLGPHPKAKPGAQDLGNLSLASFDQVAERYRALYPTMSDDLRRIRSVTAEEYWIPSLRVAEAHTLAGGEAYVYRLDFAGDGRFAGLAFHSYDLRFVWDFFGSDVPSDAAQTLAREVHSAWVAFIQGKAPAAPGLPAWPVYDLEKRPTMLLDARCRIELDPAKEERMLWDGLLES